MSGKPGANARTVAETVAAPIEQEINGVEGMLYMSSRSTNDGRLSVDVTFNTGTNLDMAQVLVQNRVASALSRIPEEARRQGVNTRKRSPSILLCVNLVSDLDPDTGESLYDMLFLGNYATTRLNDMLARQLRIYIAVLGLGYVYPIEEMVADDTELARCLHARDTAAALRAWDRKVDATLRFMTAHVSRTR